MSLYTSRRKQGKPSSRGRHRLSTRKFYTGKVRRSRRSRNIMYGGGNDLTQQVINTYRSTIDAGLNMYNGFLGNPLVYSPNPTMGHFL